MTGDPAPHLAPASDALLEARTLVNQNHWKQAVPVEGPVADWARLTVAVVIPAYQAQRMLPMVLAALAHQDYPADLTEVVVVDDGSTPALTLEACPQRPARTRIVSSRAGGWGRAHACQSGVEASTSDVVLFFDADMVAFADHITEHMRIHHSMHDAAVIGHKRFVEQWASASDDAIVAAAAGDPDALFPADQTKPSEWLETAFAASDDLADGDHECFRFFTGASGSMMRSLLERAGGLNASLRLGEDTELGYRLGQVGAVFVPMLRSSSWHLGPSTAQTDGGASARWNEPHFAQLIPLRRYVRKRPHGTWAVPLIEVVLDARGRDPLVVRAAVERWLAMDEFDLVVRLIGPWASLSDERRSVLRDPESGWYVLREWFIGEHRVDLVDEAPADAFPSAYRITARADVAPEPWTMAELFGVIDAPGRSAGWVRALVQGCSADDPLVMSRTAAVHRAARAVDRGMDPRAAEAAVWGARWVDGEEMGLALGTA